MKTIEFIEEFLWAIGLGIFVSGIVILDQSQWTNWTITIVGFVILIIATILKAKIKK